MHPGWGVELHMQWWHSLLSADPISLDPLCDLPYPPFVLSADLTQRSDNDYFDGHILALYLVSTGQFTHPVSRRQITREECAALDRYLLEHGLDAAQVSRRPRPRNRAPPLSSSPRSPPSPPPPFARWSTSACTAQPARGSSGRPRSRSSARRRRWCCRRSFGAKAPAQARASPSRSRAGRAASRCWTTTTRRATRWRPWGKTAAPLLPTTRTPPSRPFRLTPAGRPRARRRSPPRAKSPPAKPRPAGSRRLAGSSRRPTDLWCRPKHKACPPHVT